MNNTSRPTYGMHSLALWLGVVQHEPHHAQVATDDRKAYGRY